MRTLLFIVVGLVIVGIAVWSAGAARRRLAAALFTVGWLAAAIWNLRTGMSHGYSLQEELPIQLLIFAVPVTVGWLLAWKAPTR